MKAVKKIVIVVLALAFAVYILLPVGLGLFASFKNTSEVGSPPDWFSELQLTTDDGVTLGAWYIPPQNGAAIILLPGANGTRDSLRAYADFLSKNSYGVLALDMRGNGESGGGGNSFGWNSAKDIAAAVAFLEDQEDVKAIGGLGLSMGGEALLGALSSYPQIKAVVTDGATQRSLEDYLVLPSRQSLFRSWSTRVMYASVALFTGDKPPMRLADSIGAAKDTRILMIAAGTKKSEIEYGEYFQEIAGGRAELWVVPGAGHTGAYDFVRAEYKQRVLDFFSETLLESQ